ncbi:hypothetical protein PHLGIDRAFT_119070, partial [Phlebiopsis gigantea 11061_1 CR5-6]
MSQTYSQVRRRLVADWVQEEARPSSSVPGLLARPVLRVSDTDSRATASSRSPRNLHVLAAAFDSWRPTARVYMAFAWLCESSLTSPFPTGPAREAERSPSVPYDMVDTLHVNERLYWSPGGHQYVVDIHGHPRPSTGHRYDADEDRPVDLIHGPSPSGGRTFYAPGDPPGLPDVNIDGAVGRPSQSEWKHSFRALDGHDLMKIFPPNPPNPPHDDHCHALFKRQMHAFLSEFPTAVAPARHRDHARHLPVVRARSNPSPTSPTGGMLPEQARTDERPDSSRRSDSGNSEDRRAPSSPPSSAGHAPYGAMLPSPPIPQAHRRDPQTSPAHAHAPAHASHAVGPRYAAPQPTLRVDTR